MVRPTTTTSSTASTTAAEEARLTVVIPVWGSYVNAARRAVASVRADPTPARVLIVDNGNTPPLGGFEGCEILRSEVRHSRGGSRNLGLAAVETPYVMFLDADDALLQVGLRDLAEGLEARPRCDAFVGRILESGGQLHRLPRSFCGRLSRLPRLLGWANAVWPVISLQGCALLRTRAVRSAGGYCDVSMGEEWALATVLAFRGRLAFTQTPVLSYDLGPASPGVGRGSTRALLKSAARLRERLQEQGVPLAGTPGLAVLMCLHIVLIVVVRPTVRRYLRPALRRSPLARRVFLATT
jgi:hypothetical protein